MDSIFQNLPGEHAPDPPDSGLLLQKNIFRACTPIFKKTFAYVSIRPIALSCAFSAGIYASFLNF